MKSVIIIAEAGVNHNGNLSMAFELIDAAADAGADYVKFQTFRAETIVSKQAKKAEYQKVNLKSDSDTQFEMLKSLEISFDDHFKLQEYCKERNIGFLSTGFDDESVSFLASMGIDYLKIPSGEITNKPYLKHVASQNKPIILSTGMCTMQEISAALDIIKSEGVPLTDLYVLHCNTEYPTPMGDVNLMAMLDIQKTLGVNVGYSDHTIGIEVPIAAVALGAIVIEKHFTLDKNLPGPDHAASIDPIELKAMVQAIRNIELAISSSGKKEPSASELKNILVARRSLHLTKNLPKDHILGPDDLIALRPGTGISPMEIEKVIGKKLNKNQPEFTLLKYEDIT